MLPRYLATLTILNVSHLLILGDLIISLSIYQFLEKFLDGESFKFFHFSYPFKKDQEIPDPEWEIYLRETAKMMIQQQNSEKFFFV